VKDLRTKPEARHAGQGGLKGKTRLMGGGLPALRSPNKNTQATLKEMRTRRWGKVRSPRTQLKKSHFQEGGRQKKKGEKGLGDSLAHRNRETPPTEHSEDRGKKFQKCFGNKWGCQHKKEKLPQACYVRVRGKRGKGGHTVRETAQVTCKQEVKNKKIKNRKKSGGNRKSPRSGGWQQLKTKQNCPRGRARENEGR